MRRRMFIGRSLLKMRIRQAFISLQNFTITSLTSSNSRFVILSFTSRWLVKIVFIGAENILTDGWGYSAFQGKPERDHRHHVNTDASVLLAVVYTYP